MNHKGTGKRDITFFDINLNQIGYRPFEEKRAVVRNAKDETFEVRSEKSNDVVFSGKFTPGIKSGSSGDDVSYADFSALTACGKYYIKTPQNGRSCEFEISEDIYENVLEASVMMLTLQRCGCDLSEDIAGDFAHRACHTEKARIYGTDSYIDVDGGWHDAGDYGRYTSPAAKAVADLLLAYELFPEAFAKPLNIPESGNGIPDVLNEARYELEWLLRMQADDGGEYHKVTGLVFDGFCGPEECTEDLYVLPKSKTSTADMAAVMYMAARVYEKFDHAFSKTCLEAAGHALSWYENHMDEENFKNPPDCFTGEYDDDCDIDEYLWAICEGYRTTGDKAFEKKLQSIDINGIRTEGLGWDDMSIYAYFAYLMSDRGINSPFDVNSRFMSVCDELEKTASTGESYGCTIDDDYVWGSNMIVANNGMALMMAYHLTGDEKYKNAAKRQIDYLFGTNTLSMCFVTGFGTQPPLWPHHRPSQAVGKCMRGMLVGGPDSFLEDEFAATELKGTKKAACYIDNAESYSCNEVTIYWNSALVFLLAGFV